MRKQQRPDAQRARSAGVDAGSTPSQVTASPSQVTPSIAAPGAVADGQVLQGETHDGRAGGASPLTLTNLAQLVALQAGAQPDRVALVQPAPRRRTRTWAELDEQLDAVAAGLAASGLVAGQRVVLRGTNSIEFVVAYLAALRAGFVCVPVNPQGSAAELAVVLADSGARVLLGEAATEPPGVQVLPLTEEGLDRLGREGSRPVGSPADPEALAVLLYTAGTSGEPKAAMLSHRALLSHVEHFHHYGLVDPETVVLAVLPLFHVFGLNAVLGSWARGGARLVVADPAEDLLRMVVDEHVTNFPIAPSLLHRLLQQPEAERSLAGLRTVVSGAAPLPAAVSAAFTERTGVRVDQGYGLTEAAPGVTTTLGRPQAAPAAVGHPLPGVEVRVGNGTEQTEPAEIFVRGRNLFSGYWPDGRDGPDADGWFATGDIGYLEGGDLFLVDRTRELIAVNGFPVYPAEVENAIAEVPGVAEVAVIGRPDVQTGERVVAFVAGTGVTAAQVERHCAARLARFKRPAAVHLLDELPRGATGKVRKGELRRRAERGVEVATAVEPGVAVEPGADVPPGTGVGTGGPT